MNRERLLELAGLAAAGLLIWLVFERAGLDGRLAGAFFDRSRGEFPLRHNWWLAVPGHTGLKYAMVLAWLAVVAAALAPLERLRPWRREARQAALGMALAAVAVLLLRNASAHSCPWDLAAYGGTAEHFGLFAPLPERPGPGRCLPAAHASSGFALFGLYFALRRFRERAAWIAFGAAWLIGLAAGAVQVARGAHFASHVLWTAWLAYAVNFALDRVFDRASSG